MGRQVCADYVKLERVESRNSAVTVKPIMVSKETADAQLATKRLDHTARYARQGRRFEHMEACVLADAWVEAGWKCTRDITNRQLRSDFLDISTEFELRGFDHFPSDRARAVVDAFTTATTKHVEERGAAAPEGEAEQREYLVAHYEEPEPTKYRPN
jgi:hypothetical protein